MRQNPCEFMCRTAAQAAGTLPQALPLPPLDATHGQFPRAATSHPAQPAASRCSQLLGILSVQLATVASRTCSASSNLQLEGRLFFPRFLTCSHLSESPRSRTVACSRCSFRQVGTSRNRQDPAWLPICPSFGQVDTAIQIPRIVQDPEELDDLCIYTVTCFYTGSKENASRIPYMFLN